jgi:hypothetical protein
MVSALTSVLCSSANASTAVLVRGWSCMSPPFIEIGEPFAIRGY